MKEPILLIMAAGMGSRYGGLKQMDPVGPAGEVILDYSIFDAKRAGFKRVIFLIKHEIEEDFKRLVGQRLEKQIEVRYAFQQVDKIPAPFSVPEGRVKPWGTGHAVLCCKELLDAPFAVLNADDYYGVDAFQTAYDALTKREDNDKAQYVMVGYKVTNTLTENGHVARGVCSVDEKGYLTDIHERTHIISTGDGPLYTEDMQTYHRIPDDALVSMNMWGFTPDVLDRLEERFIEFLAEGLNEPKSEFLIPSEMGILLERKAVRIRVLPTTSQWFGMTYAEDMPGVRGAFKVMTDSGIYTDPLF